MSEESQFIWAPFTDEQVEALNKYQEAKYFSPVQCTNCTHPVKATKEGWVCDNCHHHRQRWALKGMDDKIVEGRKEPIGNEVTFRTTQKMFAEKGVSIVAILGKDEEGFHHILLGESITPFMALKEMNGACMDIMNRLQAEKGKGEEDEDSNS